MNRNEATIWAKSASKSNGTEITLAEHINDLSAAFNSLKVRSIDETLRTFIRLAIFCHDLGKVLPAFQIRSLGNKQYRPFDVSHNIPHSLVSALLVDQERLEERIKQVDGNDSDVFKHFILSAVAYHHWRDSFADLIQVDDAELRMLCEKLLNEEERFTRPLLENLKAAMMNVNGFDQGLLKFNVEMARGIINGVAFANYVTPPYQLYWMPKRVELPDEKTKGWILISGFLMRCDHYASFCEQEGEHASEIDKPCVDFKVVKSKVKRIIEQQDDENVWQIKTAKDCRDKNTILIAPTGFGKTEFAFLWGADEKMLYTLPLRSAVNQTFKRAQAVFSEDDSGEESVGLLHSDADVYLLGDGGQAENLKLYDFARQLSYPVIISTGDQFFPYALRPPGYEKVYSAFSYSKLVIDEVQAYNPQSAAIVVKFMEDVVRMGGKFLLMTATLPEFVRRRIEKEAEVVDIYEGHKEQLEGLIKHRILIDLIDNGTEEKEASFCVPEPELQCVAEEAKKGQRVLVILNTVKQAQDVCKRLRAILEKSSPELLSKHIWLLHSRFTLADRRDIELKMCGDKQKNVRGEFQNPKPSDEKVGKILVATQVIEASLDLDADVLFTELAPMDSLVQRMGRVLRRIRLNEGGYMPKESSEPNVFVWLFKNGLESGNSRVYERELLGITLKIISMINEENNAASGQVATRVKDWIGDKDWADIEIGNVATPGESREVTKKNRRLARKSVGKQSEAKTLAVPEGTVPLSEFDKYEVVSALYQALDPRGKYLRDFYKTLEILDSGFMSDRREEAQRLFREITSVSVIPLGKNEQSAKDKLQKDIVEFFVKVEDEDHLYTLFKKEILAKYVVSIPMNSKKFQSISSHTPELWVEEIDGITEKQRARLKRWLRGLYFVGYEYVLNQGIVQEGSLDLTDAAFL